MKSLRAHVALPLIFSITALFVSFPAIALAATIDSTNHYAWSDNGGWVNWNPTNGNVSVTDTALTGYIWSTNFGWINLSPTTGGVTNNGQGVLGGSAWGENTGWISFTGVTIDTNGIFHGETTAQSVLGTMTFDCTNCSVVTTWRPTTASKPSTSGGGGGGIVGLIAGVGGSAAVALPYNGGAAPTGAAASAGSGSQVSAPSYEFTATLEIGSTGQGVTQLQQILIADGYFPSISAPTGYFGPLTEAAVAAFQKANGLDQVGIVGPKTRTLLNQTPTPTAPTTAPATPSAMTSTQRQSLLQQFQQQLQTLLAQLAALQGQSTSTATSTPQ